MPRVTFTSHLQRFLPLPSTEVRGETVRELLEAVFAQCPQLRSYIVDDQGRLRQHVVVFINDQRIEDPENLSDRVDGSSEVFVMQALSGG